MTDIFDPPGETLPSRAQSISVTTDKEIAEVRVAYDEELVYTKDGGLRTPFLGSTVGSDGKSIEVVRTGGWPRAFDLHVEEEPAAAPGTPWTVLYEQDLRTLPNQTLECSGYDEFTIDGVKWSCATDGSSYTAHVVNGKGIQIPAVGAPSASNTYGFTIFGIRCELLEGFDPTKMTCVQVAYRDFGTGDQDLNIQAGMFPGAAVWSYVPGGVYYVKSNNYVAVNAYISGSADIYRANFVTTPGQSNGIARIGDFQWVASPLSDFAFAVVNMPSLNRTNHVPARYALVAKTPGQATLPSISDMIPYGSIASGYEPDATWTALHMGLCPGAAGTFLPHATRVRVSQKARIA